MSTRPGERPAGGQQLGVEDQLGADGCLVVQVQEHRQVAFLFGRADGRERGDFADDVVGDQELGDRLSFAHHRVWGTGPDARRFERRGGAFFDSQAAQLHVEARGIAQFRVHERGRDRFGAGCDPDAQVQGRRVSQALRA